MSEYNKNRKSVPRGSYIPVALDRHCLNGDAYINIDEAYQICCDGKQPYNVFEADLAEQLRLGKVHREGTRLYLTKTWRYENSAANHLAAILQDNTMHCPQASETIVQSSSVILNDEQRQAVCLALSHRLSIILGGAGTGKSTLIKKIVDEFHEGRRVICAPTGKAARTLTERTGYQARTVHSALGMRPDDDFLSPVVWEHVGLVAVDEASMLTVEMLAGLLCKVRRDCRIVLVGDPNQLLSVGSGNVLPDLLALDVPHIHLKCNHRQKNTGTALHHNVVDFTNIQCAADLAFDESFQLDEMGSLTVQKTIVDEAVSRYQAGENVQVLSPYNKATQLSVYALNNTIQQRINPFSLNKKEFVTRIATFRDGDRVIITKNDRERNCSNGDVGIICIQDDNKNEPIYCVELPDGRCPKWIGWEGLAYMSLAYALTVHKSQGSQYDTILFPITDNFSSMLYRNLIYTAISRAKGQVLLYGSHNAIGVAMQTQARPRRSMLVSKTQMISLKRTA